jgi:signal transduction histidine kinase
MISVLKSHFLILAVLIPILCFAQKEFPDSQIELLKTQIRQEKGANKLLLLDSLTRNIEFRSDVAYDSIARVTIQLAIKMDSIHTAHFYTSGLMAYYNNYIDRPEKAVKLYNSYFVNHMDKLNNKERSTFHLDLGQSFEKLGKLERALKQYDRVIALNREKGQEKTLARAHLYKGIVQSTKGDFATAIQSTMTAGKIYKKVQDTLNLIRVENSLSILYSRNGFFKEAAVQRKAAIARSKILNSYDDITLLNINQSVDEGRQANYKEEIDWLLKAAKAAALTGLENAYLHDILPGLAIAYAKTDSLEKAAGIMNRLRDLPNGPKDIENSSNYLKVGMNYAFAKADYPKAIELGEKHLFLERDQSGYAEIQDAQLFLSSIYEKQGRHQEAYKALKESSLIADSIFNRQKVIALTYYQTLYEAEKRELKINEQSSELQGLEIRNRQNVLYGIIGLLLIIGAASIWFFIQNKQRHKKKLKEQAVFGRQLIQAQEKERTRIAREIHDSVGQKLMLLAKNCVEHTYENCELLATESLSELREISQGLYPANLEKLGLSTSLRSMINQVDSNTMILMEQDIEDVDEFFSMEEQLQIYRIVQEALSNSVKHSKANELRVELKKDRQLVKLLIQDDGEVWNTKNIKEGLGLRIMRERAEIIEAQIEISSGTTNGSQIKLVKNV